MTDELGDLEEMEPLTWKEKMELARARSNARQALLKRNALHAEALAGISQAEKRLGVSVGKEIAQPMPKTPVPGNEAESNARENLLRRQREMLLSRQMTDVEFEDRKEKLRQQREQLLGSSADTERMTKGDATAKHTG